jgi:hypothetical protein
VVADVLLIFDCCYAGNLLPCDVNPHYPTRSFECIAACGRDKETTRPGEKSFSTALIWSLKALEKDRKSFTAQDLQIMIMKAPDFPEKQFVPLLQHDEPRDQRLVLASLSADSNSISPEFAIPTSASNKLPQNYLDLRLRYDDPLDEKEVKKLSSQFRKLIEDGSINTRRIGWLGLQKRDWEFNSGSAEKRKSDAIKNTPGPSMGGNIVSPARDLCNSTPSESNTGQSAISRRDLESPDASKVGNSMIGSMDMSCQEHKAIEMADCNLGTNADMCISREANNNQNGHEPIFAVSFDYIRRQSQGLLRGMQDISPALGVAVAVVLALSIHARYAPSLRSISLFKN